jgi:hypothetical protein
MKNLILIILIVFSTKLYSQSTNDLLQKKIGEFDIENFNRLQDSGLISKTDMSILSMYMLEMLQNGVRIDTLTYGQILDSLDVFKHKMNNEFTKSTNFGNDSVFIRTPNGEKIFIGMGELSLEKLIERESEKLPKKYKDKRLNKDFGDANQIAQTITDLKLEDNTVMLFGNTILIMTEQGKNLTNYRIGDILEIVNRIKKSKEFKPFIDKMN